MPARTADNLITGMCRLSWNLGSSDSWKLPALSRPVQDWFTFTGSKKWTTCLQS